MPSDTTRIKEQLKKKDREITELKELLAEAESEIKELNDFHGFRKPKPSILESQFLNKLIKTAAFLLVSALIVIVGIYPWIFKDDAVDDNETKISVQDEDSSDTSEDNDQDSDSAVDEEDTTDNTDSTKPTPAKPKQMLIVKSDLGWLNVRTEPNVETGDIIKKISSEDEYEWIEKVSDNWYKIKIDSEGHTGFVSGEYIELK